MFRFTVKLNAWLSTHGSQLLMLVFDDVLQQCIIELNGIDQLVEHQSRCTKYQVIPSAKWISSHHRAMSPAIILFFHKKCDRNSHISRSSNVDNSTKNWSHWQWSGSFFSYCVAGCFILFHLRMNNEIIWCGFFFCNWHNNCVCVTNGHP